MGHALRRPLAVTMGEPSGIAGEIIIKAWHAPDGRPVPSFAYIGDPNWLRAEAHRLKSHTHVIEVATLSEAAERFYDGLPVLPLPLAERPVYGTPNAKNGVKVIESIRLAVSLTQSHDALAVVTSPIHKASLYEAGFAFPGHTEFLASLSNTTAPVMMLAIEGLRVVPVTVHVSLAQAIKSLTSEKILTAARTVHQALIRDFRVEKPRLAVAALNPHAGEQGTMGDEEQRIIGPAIAQLISEGCSVIGPLPADTLFHHEARQRYDAVICMYHDQALIPLKTLDFHSGVNVTLGLPYIRTSPDHGTAFDIAGQGRANPSSLLAALRLADQLGHQHTSRP